MTHCSVLSILRHTSPEAYVWIAALLALAACDPASEGLIPLCPLDWLAVPWCPGCGLGRSVAYLFQGEFYLSFQMHPLGIPAVGVLAARITTLFADAARRPFSS